MPEPTARSPARLRVFFALWPDADARDAMAALARDLARRCGGRATRPESIHLTLAFVGDVAAERTDALRAIGAAAARAATPFDLALDRLGSFREARVAWLGVEAVPEPLAALARGLNGGLAGQGFRVDRRPFAAHVTLARSIRSQLPAETVAPVAWNVERLALVASELAAGGSRYRDVAEWPLGVPNGRARP